MEGQQGTEDQDTRVDITYMIPLTQGKFALVDEIDFALVMRYLYHTVNNRGGLYAKRWGRDGDKRINVFMHQDIMASREQRIDHVNGDGLDNRRHNLRFTNAQRNQHNRGPLSWTGYKGIVKTETGLFKAQIVAYGKWYYGGHYATKEEAARAYDKLSRLHHGEFGYLNFPDEEN